MIETLSWKQHPIIKIVGLLPLAFDTFVKRLATRNAKLYGFFSGMFCSWSPESVCGYIR